MKYKRSSKKKSDFTDWEMSAKFSDALETPFSDLIIKHLNCSHSQTLEEITLCEKNKPILLSQAGIK